MFNMDSLLQAAENGDAEAVAALLGADDKGFSSEYLDGALLEAAARGHVEVVKLLLAARAHIEDCSKPMRTSIMRGAAGGGHVEVAELLLAAGARIEAVDDMGGTALGYAVLASRVEVVRALIKAGAKLNVSGYKEWTPLYLAADTGCADVVRELLAAGADPDGGKYTIERQPDGSRVKASHWETPLMNAASRKRLDILHILLDRGANVKAVDYGGMTLLMRCAPSSDPEVMKVLLMAGADPFAQVEGNASQFTNYVGKTALDFAEEDAIIELLKREMNRRKAAALSILQAEVPLHALQEIIRLAYPCTSY